MNRLARACGQLAEARRELLDMREQVGVASRGDLTVAGQLRTHAVAQPSLAKRGSEQTKVIALAARGLRTGPRRQNLLARAAR